MNADGHLACRGLGCRICSTGCDIQILQAQLVETQKLTKAHQQRQRRQKQVLQHYGFTPAGARTVLTAYVLSGYRAHRVIPLVRRYLRLGGASVSDQECREAAESLFLQCSLVDVDHIHFPVTAAHQTAVRTARKFLAEARLVDWVRTQNTEHGVVPSAADARNVFERKTCGAGVINKPGIVVSRRAKNLWVHRWRRRWGVSRGAMPFQEDLEPTTLKQKAPYSQFGGSVCLSGKRAQDQGPAVVVQ
jgi:hypothetical protein